MTKFERWRKLLYFLLKFSWISKEMWKIYSKDTGFGFQSNKKEKNDNDAKSGGNKTKFSNASVKTCNISSSLEPENEANRNEANLVDLNYVEQLSGQENDSRNILTNQINDINNNLVKINDDVNSMGSDEIDFPDYDDVDKLNDLTASSLSIPSDVSLENLKSNDKKSVHGKISWKKEDDLIIDGSADAYDFQSLKITFV
ncbi:hypothetical protein BpHYR1_052513 [Brachionus plicatilis]|uniref:Uncharacterized protein n=1 Tax=Brachionus plicatilis TaxID=10195 RepID=A0A3M7QXM0_BRAPC|nr:hypothetical protein BpHYR1_052513 [Brachionus plicatilis]